VFQNSSRGTPRFETSSLDAHATMHSILRDPTLHPMCRCGSCSPGMMRVHQPLSVAEIAAQCQPALRVPPFPSFLFAEHQVSLDSPKPREAAACHHSLLLSLHPKSAVPLRRTVLWHGTSIPGCKIGMRLRSCMTCTVRRATVPKHELRNRCRCPDATPRPRVNQM
jgi:hypothetical protein